MQSTEKRVPGMYCLSEQALTYTLYADRDVLKTGLLSPLPRRFRCSTK